MRWIIDLVDLRIDLPDYLVSVFTEVPPKLLLGGVGQTSELTPHKICVVWILNLEGLV